MSKSKIILKPKKEDSLLRMHPWIFSGAILKIEGEPEEGDVVDVYFNNGKFAATGHYQIGSIAVRVLSFKEIEIDYNFYKQRLASAYDLRLAYGIAGTEKSNCFRLIHGEGDFLPGLIIDIYGSTAVMQAHSPGMHFAREIIADALLDTMHGVITEVYYKSDTTLPYKAQLDPQNEYIRGEYIRYGEAETIPRSA